MTEDAFIPKYGIKYRIGGPILAFFGGGLVLVELFSSVRDVSSIVFALFMLLLGTFGTIVWIRDGFIKIIFQKDRIIFVRRFVRPLTVFYTELTDLGLTQLQFGQRKISLIMMRNSDELVMKINNFVENGIISRAQISGKISARERVKFRVSAMSIIPILLVGLFIDWFSAKYLDVNLDNPVSFILASVIVLPIAYVLAKQSQ